MSPTPRALTPRTSRRGSRFFTLASNFTASVTAARLLWGDLTRVLTGPCTRTLSFTAPGLELTACPEGEVGAGAGATAVKTLICSRSLVVPGPGAAAAVGR